MCPPVYHHNGFVATHALRYMMYGTSCPYIMCPSAHDIYIYTTRILCCGRYWMFIHIGTLQNQL